MKRRLSLIFLVLAVGFFQAGEMNSSSRVQAAPSATPASFPCQWWVYDHGQGQPSLYYTDADGTPPYALRLDAGYTANASNLALSGGLDFDGDGKTDPFRIHLRPDGFYQWETLDSSTLTGWTQRAYAATLFSDLKFGDFTGDGRTDVFGILHLSTGDELWKMSDNGTANYINLNYSLEHSDQVPFRYDSDAKTDILLMFWDKTIFRYVYYASSGGTAQGVKIALEDRYSRDFYLGDFNGDGLSDRFEVVANGSGQYNWTLYPGVGGAPFVLNTTPYGFGDLQFGDFTSDDKVDVFATRLLADNSLEWLLWSGGQGNPQVINHVKGPEPRLGQFTGDSRTDALLIECQPQPSLHSLPRLDATTTESAYFRDIFPGEVNGDGKVDLIRVSGFQQGSPQTGNTIVGTLLGDGAGGFSPQPLQLLKQGDFVNYDAFPTQVNDDGLTDFIWLSDFSSISPVRVFTVVNDGQGGYLMQAPQDLAGIPYYNRGPGDFNGDGRLDLYWNATCANRPEGYSYSGCGFPTAGAKNVIYSALLNAQGVYTLSTPVDLGTPVDWKSFESYSGDVNGDGKDDLVWNSTCQKVNYDDASCTSGEANQVFVALANGSGGFTALAPQTYGSSGWGAKYAMVLADVTGEGRDDLVWLGTCSNVTVECMGDNLTVRVGIANANGTFQVTDPQDLGFGYWNFNNGYVIPRLLLGDFNGDGLIDLALTTRQGYYGPDLLAEVLLYSNGDGTFTRTSMEFINGKDWYKNLSRIVTDLTGDGKAEQVWGRSTDYGDLLYVVGNLPGRDLFLPLLVR